MTDDEMIAYVESLPDEALYEVSLQKDKNGRYTRMSFWAYRERQTRSGAQCNLGSARISNRCRARADDMYYYGYVDDNRY